MDGGDLDGAISAFRSALRIRPGGVMTHVDLGVALSRRGDLDHAIAAYRDAIRIAPNRAELHVRLGGALVWAGDFGGAVQSYRRAAALEPGNTDYADPLADAERLAAASDRLPAVLRGEDTPATGEEWVALARICSYTKDYATSARFYEQVFAADPRLADDLPAGHRYNAACAAARAGGEWHERALAWLRTDLGLRELQLDGDPTTVARVLRHWMVDRDLESVRDAASLPDAWKRLWADVDALLAKAEERTK